MSPKSIVFDPNANAVIEAIESTGVILTESQKLSCDNLIKRFKLAQLWAKQRALYGILGGTANAHKWNWLNPLDTNPAFRLTFSGTWTHSPTGMLPSSAYADTHLAPSAVYTADADNKHLSFYSRTNASTIGASSSIGSDNSTAGYCRMTVRGVSNQRTHVFGGTNGTYSDTETDSRGYYIATRQNATASQLYKNFGIVGNGNTANGPTSNIPQTLLIGAARSAGTVTYYDNKQCAFASIGDYLTQGQVSDQFNIVEQYQVDNSRGLVIGWKPTSEIGTGTNNNYELPFKGIYHYSQSGCIYLTSELGNLPKTIKSLQLFFAGFTTPYTVTNQELWIAHVAESAFDAAPAVNFSDLTITNLTKVKNSFTHTVTNNNQWYQFDFDTNFNYNGTSNLLLIWKNIDGSASISGAGYGRTSNATNRGMYKFSDPAYPTGDGTRISEVLNVKFLWDWVE